MTQKDLPRFIMRDCNLWADRENKIGQIGDITPPAPAVKLEEMRNAGMIKPRQVNMGYETLEFSFKMPGFDPQIIGLYGLKPGADNMFLITGALVDESGDEHSAVMTVRGFLHKADPGTWKGGDVAEADYAVAVNYYKVEVDGRPIVEMDDFDIIVEGVSQRRGIRNALLLD